MSRPRFVGGLLALFAGALMVGLVGSKAAGKSSERGFFERGVLRRVSALITKNYVEPVEEKQLFYGALRGMTDTLDPHSQFLTPEEREETEIDTHGRFGGLGIVIEKPFRDGPIVIVTPFLGTPAAEAGLMAGDEIVAILDESAADPEAEPSFRSTAGMRLDEAVHLLRGEPGTAVNIKVRRNLERGTGGAPTGRLLAGSRLLAIDGRSTEGMKESQVLELLEERRGKRVEVTVVPGLHGKPRDVEIVRREIEVPSIEFVRMADEEHGIGYVKLARFQEDTPKRLREAIDGLREEGMRALVLDLRGNPGGLLKAAVGAADLFLESGRIVSTRARSRGGEEAPEKVSWARGRGTYTRDELPLAVLVDKGSASAAEILAAAVGDNKRGIVVGSRTFGKGSVQKLEDVELGPDPETHKRLVGSLKITTEKYYTPSGVCIQREKGSKEWGVEPDIIVEVDDNELYDLRRGWQRDRVRLNRPEAPAGEEDRPESPGPEPRVRDRVIERALEVLRAVLVFSEPAG